MRHSQAAFSAPDGAQLRTIPGPRAQRKKQAKHDPVYRIRIGRAYKRGPKILILGRIDVVLAAAASGHYERLSRTNRQKIFNCHTLD